MNGHLFILLYCLRERKSPSPLFRKTPMLNPSEAEGRVRVLTRWVLSLNTQGRLVESYAEVRVSAWLRP